MLRNKIHKSICRSSGRLLEFLLITVAVTSLHFPSYKHFINYGDPKLSEADNARKIHTGDNIRYFVYYTILFEKNFKNKFNRPLLHYTSRLQAEFGKYTNLTFPKYYGLLARLYAYPPEKVGYTYTMALVSAFFPDELFRYKIPRLVLINLVLYALTVFVLYKIYTLYFGKLLSCALSLFSTFDVCLTYISYDYNSHSLCGIFYLVLALYLYLETRMKASSERQAFCFRYFLTGLFISFSFISSTHVVAIFPLTAIIFLDIAFSGWRLKRKTAYLLTFTFGTSAMILFLVALESLLGFHKYGMFTFLQAYQLQRKWVLLVDAAIPSSPITFVFYNFAYYNDLRMIYVFIGFLALTWMGRKRILGRKEQSMRSVAEQRGRMHLARLLRDPLFILVLLFLCNLLSVPVLRLAVANRASAISNFLIMLILSFSVGKLSRFYIVRRKGS